MNEQDMWKKAKLIYLTKATSKKNNELKIEYYETTDPDTQKIHYQMIQKNRQGTIITCSCTPKNIRQYKKIICSHIAALIMQKINEIGVKK